MASKKLGSPLHTIPKIKILIKGKVVTIKGDNQCATITNKGPILEVELNQNDEELYNFETIAVLEKDQASLTLILTQT